jgi:tetratricopeptide (TPR) repeat protein
MVLEEHDMHTNDDAQISRRDALRRLAMLPLLTLKLNALQFVLHHPTEDILAQCTASIAACWELSKSSDGADLTLAFKSVSAYVPTLKAIVKGASRHQKEAANLVGQCSILKTMLGWHLEGPKTAIVYSQDAVTYAREAGDTVLLLSALDYQAWLYYYGNCSKKAQNTVEQTLSLLKGSKAPLPPRLVGGIYSTMAVMQARNGQRATAPLRQAVESFFSGQEEEHHYVYIDYTKSALVLNDGMAHYQQGDYDKATDSLSQLIDPETLALKMALPERSYIEGLNILTLASLKLGKKDMERTLFFWQAAIQGASTLQSEQRFQEALLGYEIMRSVWPGEKRIVGLRDLVVHW